MSFILDALKKSESERQQQAGAEFSDIPTGPGEPPSFKWLWILAVILLVNLVVLLAILFRPEAPSEPVAPVQPPATIPPHSAQPRAAEPSFAEQVAEVKRSQPATAPTGEDAEPAGVTVINEPGQPESRTANAIAMLEDGRPMSQPASDRPSMKTFDELRLEGAVQLADLHVDIHVFAEDPAERFVFINMNKHAEKSTLAEGPLVKEITTDGVVLEYQGNTFLLPRE